LVGAGAECAARAAQLSVSDRDVALRAAERNEQGAEGRRNRYEDEEQDRHVVEGFVFVDALLRGEGV
jgi:hypothetical protein